MAKNMTRKSVALGAGIALVGSGLTFAPAYAAGIDNGSVSLAPNAGTSYLVLAGSTFDLKANAITSISGTTDKDLKFYVSDPEEVVKVDVDVNAQDTQADGTLVASAFSKAGAQSLINFTTATNVATGTAVYISSANATTIAGGLEAGWYTATNVDATHFTIDSGDTATAAGSTAEVTLGVADTDDVDVRDAIVASSLGSASLIGSTAAIASSIGGVATVDGRLANGDFVVNTNTNSNAVDRVLRLVNTDATTTASVSVTAWVDDNDNNAIDPTEYVSPTRTVSFHVNADLTVTTVLDAPVLGAGTLTGSVAIAPELNGQQVGNTDVTATFTVQDASTQSVASDYDPDDKVWYITNTLGGESLGKVVVGNYTMKAKVAAAAIGTTQSASVAARTAADTKVEVAAGDNQTYVKDQDASDGIQTSTIRKGKAASVVITAYDALGAALGAGKAVTVVYSSATDTTDFTVNGVKVLDNATGATKVYTTDANGQVTLTVSSTLGAVGDTVSIQARPENLAADNAATAEVKLVWADATYTLVDANSPTGLTTRTINKTGSVTYDFFVGDDWNAPLTGDFRLYVTASGRAVYGANHDLVNGGASVTIADAALGTGSEISVSAVLQKKGTDGTWATSTAPALDFSSTVTAADAPTTAVVPAVAYTEGATTGYTLTPTAISAYHVDKTQGSFTSPAGAVVASIALAGIGVANGDLVTVSGTGMFFGYDDNGTVKAVGNGSLTFVAGDITQDSVEVYSNVYQKNAVVTVESRGRSGTVKVTSDEATPDSGRSVEIDAPASVTPGSTYKVTMTLKDLFGNVVDSDNTDVDVTYSGPGIVFGNLPSDTGVDGTASFAVLLGSNDTGTATITFCYDTNNDADYVDLYEFCTSKTVVVGTAGNTGAYSSWTKKLDDNSAKMYAKNVVGEGKVQFFLNGEEIAWVRAVDATDPKLRTANGSAYLVRTVEFEDGKNVLEIYVDGVRTTRTAYTK